MNRLLDFIGAISTVAFLTFGLLISLPWLTIGYAVYLAAKSRKKAVRRYGLP